MQKTLFLILFYVLSSLAVGAHDVLTYGQNDREVLINALHTVSEDDISSWMLTMTVIDIGNE